MKKDKILIAMGIVTTIIALLILYFVPWLDLISFHMGIPPCIGRGCHVVGGGGGMELGYVQCRGYPGYLEFGYFGLICFPDAESYCRYAHPLEFKEKCLCESYTRVDISAFRKFCSKDGKCYTNSFEYEFGCTSDMERTCREVEKEISEATPEDCIYAWGHDVVSDMSQCSQMYIYIYGTSDETHKRIIFNKGYVERKKESVRIKDICDSLCKNCDSIVCTKDHLCEHVLDSSKNEE